MIRFFSHRPKLGLAVVTVLFFLGIDVARRTQHKAPRTFTASLAPRPLSPTVNWQRSIDLSQAKVTDSRLSQTLTDGTRIDFTLDPELQQWALAYLKGYQVPYAAMVLIELPSQKVRVLAGYSERKPEIHSEELTLTPWAPAASIFKLITAAALLDSGVSPTATICHHGGFHELTADHLRPNAALDTTCQTLSDGVAYSINPILARLASANLQRDEFQRWVERFGFNQATPFAAPTEPSRVDVPVDDMERARMAAGFWHSTLSPLHAAVIASTIASGGKLHWPRLVEAVQFPSGARTEQLALAPAQHVIGASSARALTAMMIETTVVGSGRSGFAPVGGERCLPTVSVAGKTGTLSRNKPYIGYSWFVGFAPADKPRVAFSVLLGNPEAWRIKASFAACSLLQRVNNQKPLNPEHS